MLIFEYGYKKGDYFKRNIFTAKPIEFDDKDLYVSAYNYIVNDDFDINEIKNINFNEITKIGDFYIDLDCNAQEEYKKLKDDAITVFTYLTAVLKIDSRSIQIYYSGSKGFHFVVDRTVMNIQPRKDLNRVFKSMAEEIKSLTMHGTIDTQIYDSRRLFRVKNTINTKSGLYKIPITPIELKSLDINDIKLLANKKREVNFFRNEYSRKAENFFKKHVEKIEEENKRLEEARVRVQEYAKNKVEITNKNITPCIKNIIINGAKEGYRNNSATALASFFMQKGYSPEETYDIINDWNNTKCFPSIPEREIKTLIDSVYKHGYKYGCSKLSEISVCDENKCPIFSEI